MLAAFRRYLDFHRQAALSSLRTLSHKPLASLMTILVMALTLVLPTVFWILSDNMMRLASHWNQEGRVTLYLKHALPSQDIDDFFLQVKQMPEVAEASMKSSTVALAELEQQEGMQDIMHYLPENPLPAIIEVIPVVAMRDPEQLELFYKKLIGYSQVEQATFDLQWMRRFYAMSNFIKTMAHGLIILLGLSVVFIISNISRLSIQSRQEEIRILKLIGAKNAYISRPFLYTGIWYGLGSALAAVIMIDAFMMSLSAVTQQIAAAYEVSDMLLGLSLRHLTSIIGLSLVLGWLGAYISVFAYIFRTSRQAL